MHSRRQAETRKPAAANTASLLRAPRPPSNYRVERDSREALQKSGPRPAAPLLLEMECPGNIRRNGKEAERHGPRHADGRGGEGSPTKGSRTGGKVEAGSMKTRPERDRSVGARHAVPAGAPTWMLGASKCSRLSVGAVTVPLARSPLKCPRYFTHPPRGNPACA